MMASCDVVDEPGRREDLSEECLGVMRVRRFGIRAISGFFVSGLFLRLLVLVF